jgi:hypothetical protein
MTAGRRRAAAMSARRSMSAGDRTGWCAQTSINVGGFRQMACSSNTCAIRHRPLAGLERDTEVGSQPCQHEYLGGALFGRIAGRKAGAYLAHGSSMAAAGTGSPATLAMPISRCRAGPARLRTRRFSGADLADDRGRGRITGPQEWRQESFRSTRQARAPARFERPRWPSFRVRSP